MITVTLHADFKSDSNDVDDPKKVLPAADIKYFFRNLAANKSVKCAGKFPGCSSLLQFSDLPHRKAWKVNKSKWPQHINFWYAMSTSVLNHFSPTSHREVSSGGVSNLSKAERMEYLVAGTCVASSITGNQRS